MVVLIFRISSSLIHSYMIKELLTRNLKQALTKIYGDIEDLEEIIEKFIFFERQLALIIG